MEKTTQNPELSVVMPLYNSERTIAKTLETIFRNTFKNFEIVVIDDGSNDRSAEIAKNYPVKIVRQENAGPAKARNAGVKIALADIIVFIDSDVIIPDFTLKKIYDAYQNDKNLEMIAGMPDSLNHYKNKISDYENLYINYQFNKQKDRTTAFYTSLVAIKKELFQKFNGFDERIRIPEDMELGQRLLAAGHFIRLDKTLQFSHQNHFTIYSYIKKQILKTSGILKIKLRNIKRGRTNRKCYDASLFFQLGVPISLLVPLNFLLALIFWSMIFIYIAIGVSIFLIIINWKMLSYLRSKRDFNFLIFSCLFLIFNYWMYALGLGYGLATFLTGKEY